MPRNVKVEPGAVMIVRANYNPGMNPFAPQPAVRFPRDAKPGDAGVEYEFNVKIRKIACAATQDEWDQEVSVALDRFRDGMRRYKGLAGFYFTGRSAGWLLIKDVDGRMTEGRLLAIRRRVGKALAEFKRYMVETYPRPRVACECADCSIAGEPTH